MTDRDAYAVLQVAADADDAAVSAAYRAQARRFHPDLVGPAGTRRMVVINAAWDAVRTPDRRAAYDRGRRAEGRMEPDAGPAEGRATGDAAPRDAAPRDAASYWQRPGADGTGSAGRPPGRPSGSVLAFGRHIGWSLGEVARVDPGYQEWLEDRPDGSRYRAEIDDLLKRVGRRRSTDAAVPATRRRFGGPGRTRSGTSR
jgi:curved DNA-binding protein CbpA